MNGAAPALPVEVQTRAALNTKPAVLPRAEWKVSNAPDGTPAFGSVRGGPIPRGTWFAWILRKRDGGTVVMPLVSCPKCGGLTRLHTDKSTPIYRVAYGRPNLPVVHKVESNGKVSPDVACANPRCDFHRTVYLDRWNRTKPLWAIAYVEMPSGRIQIDYTNAVNGKEALFHFGMAVKDGKIVSTRKNVQVIGAGPAVGFFVNERTGKMAVVR
jgi:hypothetical protein